MSNTRPQLRPAMTAIAAALVFSSTPLFAQSTDAAPVMVAPPPPVLAPSAAPADAPGPAIVAPSAPVLESPMATTASSMQTIGTPVVHIAPAPRATPAVTRAAPAPRVAVPRVTSAAAPVVERAATPIAPAPLPVAAPAPAPADKSTAAPGPVQQVADSGSDDTLLIGGIAGAALLALTGGALALGRRRRRDEDDTVFVPETVVEPVVVNQPAMAFADSPASLSGPTTTLPNGFDLSRFGRHTKAAYRGPTLDNPSLSLKKRLKRASFFDQRERMAAAGEAAPVLSKSTPDRKPVAEAARGTTDHITVSASKVRPTFRPAF